jgi:hypothetical protein
MKTNHYMNFTNHMLADMEAFLKVIHGSFLTTSKQPLPILKQAAEIVFNNSSTVHDKGLYDKLIMDCSFKQNLFTKRPHDFTGGCKSFHPVLTSNGFCYSFNSNQTSDVWKQSKVIKSFQNVFKWEPSREHFRGPGIVEGKFDIC